MTAALDTCTRSYAAVHRGNGAVVQHDAREQVVPCAIQPRDLEIVRRRLALPVPDDADRSHELWWAGAEPARRRRRMTRLFEAGFVERFRPQTLRGSYQWTYCLGARRVPRGAADRRARHRLKFAPRRDGDLRLPLRHPRPALNEWVIAYRGCWATDCSTGRSDESTDRAADDDQGRA